MKISSEPDGGLNLQQEPKYGVQFLFEQLQKCALRSEGRVGLWQCDQIGLFLKGRGDKLSYNRCPKFAISWR